MQTQFYREKDLVNRRATVKNPASTGILNISKSTFWKLIKNGKFPQGVKISERTTAWRAEDVHEFIAKLGNK